jgi:hypothetical protein
MGMGVVRCLWNCNIFIRNHCLTGGGAVALLAGAAAVLLVAGTISTTSHILARMVCQLRMGISNRT